MIPIKATKQQEPEDLHLESAHLANKVAASAYEIRAVPALISYHHASLGNISKPTFLQYTITGFYATFPGLTPALIRKYLTKAETKTLESSTYGHQKLVRQNIRSSRRLRSKIHNVTIAIIRDDDLGQDLTNMIAMDLTG